jgi:hypothetical protein
MYWILGVKNSRVIWLFVPFPVWNTGTYTKYLQSGIIEKVYNYTNIMMTKVYGNKNMYVVFETLSDFIICVEQIFPITVVLHGR